MKNNYIRHVPYLRNSIVYDHDFWYACVNENICKWVFFFFFFFGIFISWAVRGGGGGKREKKGPKKKKKNTYIMHDISRTVWHKIMIIGTLV